MTSPARRMQLVLAAAIAVEIGGVVRKPDAAATAMAIPDVIDDSIDVD